MRALPDKGQLQEALVTLYLRLNGYLTSGFIVHSPEHGKNKAELDIVAVRFPGSAEPERGVDVDAALDPSKTLLDIVVAEVKSRGQSLRFNDSLRSSPGVAASVLRWIGSFPESEIPQLAVKFVQSLDPAHVSPKEAPMVLAPGNARVRGLLFSPEYDKHRDNQPWFLPGPPVLDYIWRCLRPAVPRGSCATTYDFGAWGPGLAFIVRHFKETKDQPATFRQLCKEMLSNRA